VAALTTDPSALTHRQSHVAAKDQSGAAEKQRGLFHLGALDEHGEEFTEGG
jgi:hypothetical protein